MGIKLAFEKGVMERGGAMEGGGATSSATSTHNIHTCTSTGHGIPSCGEEMTNDRSLCGVLIAIYCKAAKTLAQYEETERCRLMEIKLLP